MSGRDWVGIGLLATMASCHQEPVAPAVSQDARERHAGSEVHVFGQLREILHDGKTGPVTKVHDALASPHAFAVGALSGLRGEVTIFDGEVWLAYPSEGSVRVVQDSGTTEWATLLVLAHVSSWATAVVPTDVPFEKLDAFVESVGREAGLDVDGAFAVRIEGSIGELAWHVVNGAGPVDGSVSHADHLGTSVRGKLQNADVRLVGFFGQKAQGVFTHMGRRTHFHVVEPASRTMGHVDEVDIRKGARVFVALP